MEQQLPDGQTPGPQLGAIADAANAVGESVASLSVSAGESTQVHGDDVSEDAALSAAQLSDYHYVLDLVTTQAPCAPLNLPFVTLQSVSHACESRDLKMLLYRVAEVQEGQTAQEVMAGTDIKAVMDSRHVATMLHYISPSALVALECSSTEKAKELIANVWGRSALQNEWRSIMRNLASGILHVTQQRGVLYQQGNNTAFNLATTYLLAEQEPSTGKTYLSVLRRVEVLDIQDKRITSAAMLDLMALKYSSTMMLMVCPNTGRVVWQNNASCAAIGTLASCIALPVRGSCDIVEFDYLGQIFMGNQDVRREMEAVVATGSVFKRRMQIKGPELRAMLGAKPTQEVWHFIQFSTLKDPISHLQVIMMGQTEITDVVLAERRVKQLQKQQLNLLKEMLPQQVIELLLAQNKHRSSMAQSQPQSPFQAALDIAAFARSGDSDVSSPDLPRSPVKSILPLPRGTAARTTGDAATAEEEDRPSLAEQRSMRPLMSLSPFASAGTAMEASSSERDSKPDPEAAVAHVRIAEPVAVSDDAPGTSDDANAQADPSASLRAAFAGKRMNSMSSGSHVVTQDLSTLIQAMDECPIMSGYCLWNKADKVQKMKMDKRTRKDNKRQAKRCMKESRIKELLREQEGKEDGEGTEGSNEGQQAVETEEAEEEGQDAQGHTIEQAQQQPEQQQPEQQQPEQQQLQQQPEDGAYAALEHERASRLSSLPMSSRHSLTNSSSYGSDLQLSRRDVMSLATWHEEATILFTDLKGFTSMSSSLHPAQIMLFLNHLYSMFDDLVGLYDVYKVETIGDSYMVAAGLFDRSEAYPAGTGLAGSLSGGPLHMSPTNILIGADSATGTHAATAVPRDSVDGVEPTPAGPAAPTRDTLGGYDPEHASKMMAFAKAMLESASKVVDPLGNRVQMRVGIHSGSVMSGVVGRKCPRFCLFGDTVNTASRMESTGEPGRIHASQEFRDLVPEEKWLTQEVFAKGKGTLNTYYLDFELPEPEDNFGDEALLPSYL